MTNTIAKTFAKRETEKSEGGEIGQVELVTPAKAFQGWTWNGKDIPEASVAAIVGTYFFQGLSDAYAASKTIDEAKGRFDGRVDAMLAGELGVRGSGGDGASELQREMRKLVRKPLKDAKGADWYKANVTDADAADANVILDKLVEANVDKLTPIAEAQIKARKEQAKKANALATDIDVG